MTLSQVQPWPQQSFALAQVTVQSESAVQVDDGGVV